MKQRVFANQSLCKVLEASWESERFDYQCTYHHAASIELHMLENTTAEGNLNNGRYIFNINRLPPSGVPALFVAQGTLLIWRHAGLILTMRREDWDTCWKRKSSISTASAIRTWGTLLKNPTKSSLVKLKGTCSSVLRKNLWSLSQINGNGREPKWEGKHVWIICSMAEAVPRCNLSVIVAL